MKAPRILSLLLLCFFYSCQGPTESAEQEERLTSVLFQTTMGNFTIELSDNTPQHRDNFIKLVEEGTYDSLLFHRVIEGFVVQGGDPESKTAVAGDTLGNGDLGYTIPAEFDTTLFHKRGAVGAARDGNPERASSAIQFYVVQASKPLADSVIDRAEGRINGWLKEHYSLNDPANKIWKDSLETFLSAEEADWETYLALNDTIKMLAEGYDDFEKYSIPQEHREVYREVGGTPFLDQNYTVFGEVVSGMEVIDSIAVVQTDSLDRPVYDVRILKASVLE